MERGYDGVSSYSDGGLTWKVRNEEQEGQLRRANATGGYARTISEGGWWYSHQCNYDSVSIHSLSALDLSNKLTLIL